MENSKIEWTDHTFNPWIGCTKVNTLCQRCYAWVMMDVRYQRVKWGPKGTRARTTDGNWRKPLTWDRKAKQEGIRRRVFCASLADVFEDFPGLDEWRSELFELIDRTPYLDWLLLTKRPDNIGRMWPLATNNDDGYRHNVWLGTSVGTVGTAEECAPSLRQWRKLAPVLFLSVEPLLEAIPHLPLADIDWAIVGGESGLGAHLMEKEWVTDVKRQCDAAGVAFFFKQWGGVKKGRAGRELLGQTWDAIPMPVRANTISAVQSVVTKTA